MADSGQYHKRPTEAFRFRFGGMKTNSTPDAVGPDKYPYARDVRSFQGTSVQARQGYAPTFPTNGFPVTDLHTYSALLTDNLPRVLARGTDNNIWLGQPPGSSSRVGTLAGSGQLGAAMIPFRPAESPVPWMYIANGADYQKFSAPGVADAVTQQKVGIAEPQFPCDAALGGASSFWNTYVFSSNPTYVHGSVASAAVNQTRVTDTVQSVFSDPNFASLLTLGVSASPSGTYGTSGYTPQMIVVVGGNNYTVEDVYPAQPTPIGIAAIYYFTGTTGRCVVVPNNQYAGPGTEGQSIYDQDFLASIRRGSLVEFSGGSEICYVLSVTEGPNGTISFETSTTGTHTAAETFTQPAAIQLIGSATVGATIVSATVGFNLSGAGIGTQTSSASLGNIFVTSQYSFQPDDYVHVSVVINTLASLNEIKVLFDVGDGSFTQNFYYYTIRVSDIQAAVNNTLTQLGAAQLVTQRALIDQEQAIAARNQGTTQSGDQMTPGDGQFADILIPIGSFTRVGTNQSLSLQNTNAIQFLFNVNAATDASIGVNSVTGGGQPDVGPSGAPYMYRVRPRSSVTGAKGNPSPAPRYGVNPRRIPVNVYLPSASYDAQIDTWDVFRYGGTVTSWRKIGQCASTSTMFLDNFSDDAALAGEELEFDNLEPWPSLDLPLNVASVSVCGTTAVVPLASPGNVLRYLPGNLVQIGSTNVYTLRVRPTLISGSNYLFQFVENAGAGTGLPLSIYEPALANQHLPYMWGPDAAGTVFAVGDSLRPGTLYFAKNYAPDAAPDSYNIEITAPSEPLLGGEVLDGLSFAASPDRWWALYPQSGNPLQRYSVIEQPMTRGLAAPYGHCNDGKSLYWWAKDGIYSSSKGSLTDADLYNLFPHDGVAGANYIYNGQAVYAPNYANAGTFRLVYCNFYLYAIYTDQSGIYRKLTLDTRTGAWVVDTDGMCSAHVPDQQLGPVLTSGASQPYQIMYVGSPAGGVSVPIAAAAVSCVIATVEWDGGDLRAGEQWGDAWAYLTPQAPAGVVVTPMALGAPVAPSVTILPAGGGVAQTPISLGGELLSDFLGLQFAWTEDYTRQLTPTLLQAWQLSFIPKPEMIADRITDWYNAGTEAAKYVQGFLLHADTTNVVKGLQVRDADTLALHPFTPAVQHNGESIKAYSFTAPFIAHSMRLEPTDQVSWRFFDVQWVFEPTSESAETWQTQGTAHGLQGYMHVKQVSPCYAATAAVTLTITSFDGQSPQPIILPATGGAMQKVAVMLTANKGQLYFYVATSSAPFQLFLENWEIEVGQWARQDNYLRYRNLGDPTGDQARL